MALTAKFVATAKPGRHLDADGLYLNVSPTGRKTWVHSPTARRTGQIGTCGKFSDVFEHDADEGDEIGGLPGFERSVRSL